MENNETIGDRFSLLIKKLGKTENSFAKSIAKSPSMIGLIVRGASKPGFEILESVFRVYPNLNPDWLMNGKGSMFRNGTSGLNGEYPQDQLTEIKGSVEKLVEQLTVKDNQIAGLQRTVDALLMGKHRGMPCKGRVLPMYPKQELEEVI